MNDEYYDDGHAPQKSGSVLPWILLTVVVAFAGVAVVAFKTQSDQAVAAVERMKVELDQQRKHVASLDEKLQDAQKDAATAKSEKDDMEKQKNDLSQKLDQANQALALVKAEAADSKSSGGKGLAKGGRGKKIQVVSLKGKHRR